MKEWMVVLAPYFSTGVTLFVFAWLHRGQKNIHQDMNSRFDEWRELIEASSFAAGVKAEKERKV